ncbi:MAG: hypothetical protein ACI8QC_000282 [Planctomycetota bacterium]|jgi:hypothetical protein
MERHLTRRSRGFIFLAASVLATAFLLSSRLATLDEPALIAAGMTLDLTVLLPVAFYFLVARPRSWSWLTAVPVAILGALAARLFLPVDYRATLGVVELLLGVVELGVVGTVALKLRRVLRAGRSADGVDAYAQIRRAARELLPNRHAAGALASELATLHFAFFSWGTPAHVPAGTTAIGMHRRSNHGSMLVALLMLSVAEGVAAHLLIGIWSPLAAWIATLLGAYGAIWLIADYRATILRPSLIGSHELHLRAGLRWSGTIARGECIELLRKQPEGHGKPLSFTLLSEPTHWLVLRKAKSFDGPFGLQKPTRIIGLTPDDREALESFMHEPTE